MEATLGLVTFLLGNFVMFIKGTDENSIFGERI